MKNRDVHGPETHRVIQNARPADSQAIADIYNPYIRQTIITFEEKPVTADDIRRRMESVQAAGLPWLVARKETRVAGYAYATPWRERTAYRFSVEVTVYVAPDHHRSGVGKDLYASLLLRLKAAGMHSAMGGIALPNAASVGLHEKLGFEKVAHFKKVGFKFNQWIDVGYWQYML